MLDEPVRPDLCLTHLEMILDGLIEDLRELTRLASLSDSFAAMSTHASASCPQLANQAIVPGSGTVATWSVFDSDSSNRFVNLFCDIHRIVFSIDDHLGKASSLRKQLRHHLRQHEPVEFPTLAPGHCDALCEFANWTIDTIRQYSLVSPAWIHRRRWTIAETEQYPSDDMGEAFVHREAIATLDNPWIRDGWLDRFGWWGSWLKEQRGDLFANSGPSCTLAPNDEFFARVQSWFQIEISSAIRSEKMNRLSQYNGTSQSARQLNGTPLLRFTENLPMPSIATDAALCTDSPLKSGFQSSTSQWHGEHECIPVEFQYGPLSGKQKQLAEWLGKSPKSLRTALQQKTYWGRKKGRYQFELYFKTQERYSEANSNRLKDLAK